MTTRREATAVVLAARERFQRTMGLIPKWVRVAVAGSTRELATVMGGVDVGEGVALAELADLIENSTFKAGAIREVQSISRAPDHEGDEELLEQRGKMRSGWRGA